MKNYKINSINDSWSVFGSKCLTKEQDKFLKSIGFRYQDYSLRKYSKHYCYNYPYRSEFEEVPNKKFNTVMFVDVI